MGRTKNGGVKKPERRKARVDDDIILIITDLHNKLKEELKKENKDLAEQTKKQYEDLRKNLISKFNEIDETTKKLDHEIKLAHATAEFNKARIDQMLYCSSMRANQVNVRADLYSCEPEVGVILGLAGYRDEVPGYATAITVEIDSLNNLGSGSRILGDTSGLIQNVATICHNMAIKFLENTYSSSKANCLKNKQFLIHVAPLYEIKDGPSIGLAILSAFISFALNKPPKKGIAVTGEVDLKGHILPVGLIESKLRGALSAGVHQVIFPEQSTDIPHSIQQQLERCHYNLRQRENNTVTYSDPSSNSLNVVVVKKYKEVHDILFGDTT